MIKKQISNKKELILALQSAIHGNDVGRILHRMHVVLFVLEFNSIEDASRIFHDPTRTIQDWIKKVAEQGMDGLHEKKRMGRPTRLSVAQKEILRNELSLSPRDMDEAYQQTGWEGKLLSDYIFKKWNITLEARQCQRLLHELGYTLQRPRPGTIGNLEEQEAFKKKPKASRKP
jgi:transposase